MTSSGGPVLVAGGTGRLGTLVVRRLAEAGRSVRVLTRDSARASHLPAAAEVVAGDVRDRAAIERAVGGTSAVVSAVHGFAGRDAAGPEQVDRHGNAALVAAAGAGEVGRFLLLSVHGAGPDHPVGLFRAKHAAEAELRASGVPWTIVRPAAFAELWCEIVAGPVRRGGKALVFGRGENPINFVSVHDVAAVVVDALDDPSAAGAVIEVGGPEDVSLAGLVELAAPGAAMRRVPRGALRLGSRALRPVAPAIARQMGAALAMDTLDFRFDGNGAAPAGVRRVTGATTVADVLAGLS